MYAAILVLLTAIPAALGFAGASAPGACLDAIHAADWLKLSLSFGLASGLLAAAGAGASALLCLVPEVHTHGALMAFGILLAVLLYLIYSAWHVRQPGEQRCSGISAAGAIRVAFARWRVLLSMGAAGYLLCGAAYPLLALGGSAAGAGCGIYFGYRRGMASPVALSACSAALCAGAAALCAFTFPR